MSTGAHGWFHPTVLRGVVPDGINAVAVRVSALGSKAHGTKALGMIRRFATAEGLYLVAVVPAGKAHTPAARHALAACSHHAALFKCALQAPSLPAAARLAGRSDSLHPLVAVYVRSPAALTGLAQLPRRLRRRIVVIAPLPSRFDASAWRAAITESSANSFVNLGVAPGKQSSASVQQFGALLAGGNSPAAGSTDTEPPSTPSGLSTSSVSRSGMTLSWEASSDNVGVDGYRLFLDGSEVGSSTSTSYAFTGLSCGRTYTLGVAAFDAAGNLSDTATATQPTEACADTQAPSKPTGLTASLLTETGMKLSWAASTDNVGVAGYHLFLDGVEIGNTTSTSYPFAALTCGTSYTLGVSAYDAAGNVSGVATLTQSTSACTDTQAPSTPTGLTTSLLTETSMLLSWTASTDNVGVAGYHLFLDGVEIGSSTATSYPYSGLACGTSYTLGVSAYDASGNVSNTATLVQSTSACTDTQPPSTPTGLAASSVSQTGMTLSWTASTDNVGVTGYRLFLNGSQVGNTSSTSYPFTGLSCATSYTLGVLAYDASGNVSGTATLVQSTSACTDTQPPSKPTGLTTSALTQTSVTLSWTASTDNVGVTGYRLYLSGTQVGTTATTSYGYTGLSCGTTYTLGVAAYDAAGNVSARATKSTTTSACTSPPVNTALPVVSGTAAVGKVLSSSTGTWTNAPTGYTYQWQDCDSSGGSCADIVSATNSAYTLQPSDLGDTVRVVVTATNGAGSASADSAVTAVVQPAPPPSGQTVMAFDLGWDPTSNMPWSDLTQADLFNLATENGPGLDTSNVDNIDIPAWVAAAHANNVQAMISIGGEGNDDWGPACNSTNRTQFISNLINFAVSNGFDGIDLDIEDGPWLGAGPPTAAMTSCIEAISDAAHGTMSKAGKPLWVSGDVITNWDGPWWAPSESYVDQYNLMTYGDNLSTMKSDVADTYDQGLPYDKMVPGVDVSDYPEPSGGCAQFENYALNAGLMGSFVWAASGDTNNACMNQIAAAAG